MSKNLRLDDVAAYTATLLVAFEYLAALNTPRSLSVYLLGKQFLLDHYDPVTFDRELKLLGFNANLYDQHSVDALRDDYQATVLLTKLPPRNPKDQTLRDAAIKGFQDSELRNAELNKTWSGNYSESHRTLERLGVPVERITEKLRFLLGRAPSLRTLMRKGEWTTGSSVTFNREKASRVQKAIDGVTVTYGLARALKDDSSISTADLLESWRLPTKPWVLVPGNLIDTVRKNIVTDRTIAKCPEINSFFQRASGVTIADRLRGHGIDLNDQTANQQACNIAYRNSFATIDLKNASNSILLFAVMSTFPEDWADLLLTIRSPFGTLASRSEVSAKQGVEWQEYHMLSTMGNGSTFEVETALFLAICLACGCDLGETYVYGDDIIIPQRFVPLVTQVLAVYGLEVNLEKSFTSGAFFESCGVYSFFGVDVTPIKVKELLYETKDTLVLANKIRMYAHSCNHFNGCDKRFLSAWQMCVRRLPDDERKRCRGPALSGLTLFCNRNEVRSPNPTFGSRRNPYQKILTYQLIPQLRERHTAHEVGFFYRLSEVKGSFIEKDLASWLSNYQGQSLTANGCKAKEYSVGYTVAKLYVDSWYDLGAWL